MFGIHRKLRFWADTGLITPEQVAAIQSFEKNRHSGHFARSMIGVGVFTILLGVVSVVAANWAFIPGSVKLSAHLLLNVLVAALVWHADKKGPDILREGVVLALAGLTLTMIALTGQVFQLGGNLAAALSLWLLATMPMLLVYGRTLMTAIAGCLSLVVSSGFIVVELADLLPNFWQGVAVMIAAILLPLFMISAGHQAFFRALRPIAAQAFLRVGYVLLTLLASASSLMWYENIVSEFFYKIESSGLTRNQGHFVLILIFVVAFAGMFMHRILFRAQEGDQKFYDMVLGYAAVSLSFMFLPVLMPAVESNILAMLSFVAYWSYVGWFAHQTGASRLLSWAIALLTLRVFIIYIEAFGGLLSTGFALILGGIVLLLLIYAARKLNTKLKIGGETT